MFPSSLRISSVALLAATLWVGSGGFAAAADIHVDAYSGSDTTGNGSAAAPFKTISAGVSAASAGDQVRVAPGVYGVALGEVFPIPLTAGVALRSTGGAMNTVIDGTGFSWPGVSAMVLLQGDGEVSGFTFREGPTTDWWSAAVVGWGPGAVTVSGNVFRGPNLNRGLILYDLSADSSSSSSAVVRNNVCSAIGPADGLLVFDYTSVHVAHNSVDGCVRAGIAVSRINAPMTGLVANNNLTANGFFGLEGNAPQVNVRSNNFFGNAAGAVTGTFASQTGTLTVDPLYASAIDGDLHLRPGSPVRDKGAITAATDDLDGEPRPTDAGPDVGADEVVTPGTVIRAAFQLQTSTAIDTIGAPGVSYAQLLGVIPASIPTPYGTLAFDPVVLIILAVGTMPADGYVATPIAVPIPPPSVLGLPLITQSLVGLAPGGLSAPKTFALVD